MFYDCATYQNSNRVLLLKPQALQFLPSHLATIVYCLSELLLGIVGYGALVPGFGKTRCLFHHLQRHWWTQSNEQVLTLAIMTSNVAILPLAQVPNALLLMKVMIVKLLNWIMFIIPYHSFSPQALEWRLALLHRFFGRPKAALPVPSQHSPDRIEIEVPFTSLFWK